MYEQIRWSVVLAALACHPINASAASDADLQALRTQVEQLQQRLESSAGPASRTGDANAYNPAISLILGGTYGALRQDSALPATGFAMSTNPGHGQGFNLGESELGIAASIDAGYRGVATLALDPGGGVSVENAFVQGNTLGNGVKLRFGRFFSGLGYLNEQHAHAWDFVDQPLVYATFWGNQLGEDGIQLKWLAPTDTFFEVGGELGRGRGFPGTDNAGNGSGAGVMYAHIGDDVGFEHSWRAGISLHQTRRIAAVSDAVPDLLGTVGGVSNSFSGSSRTTGVDLVWKYAPNGNASETSFKLQAEFFRRTESGDLTYDTAGANITDSYTNTQEGCYVQGVYQFMRHWRLGLRRDRLDPGTAKVGAANTANVISNYGYQPTRYSLMLDYAASEFSRLRLQLAQDHSRQGAVDNQLFVQYVMSVGAHGAHQF